MNCMDLDGIPSPDRLANNIDAKHLRQIIAEAYTPSVLCVPSTNMRETSTPRGAASIFGL